MRGMCFKNCLVKFCYLTEASTAETTINNVQEVKKNYPRKAEGVIEGMDSDQWVSVTAPVVRQCAHHRGHHFFTGC